MGSFLHHIRSTVRFFPKITRGPWCCLCKFCISVFPNITKTTLIRGRSFPIPIWTKSKLPITFSILGSTLSWIAELTALLICACITFISESLSWNNLAFILLDNIPKDPASPSWLVGPLLLSLFLIAFARDEQSLLSRDSKSLRSFRRFITLPNSLSMEVEIRTTNLTSKLPWSDKTSISLDFLALAFCILMEVVSKSTGGSFQIVPLIWNTNSVLQWFNNVTFTLVDTKQWFNFWVADSFFYTLTGKTLRKMIVIIRKII